MKQTCRFIAACLSAELLAACGAGTGTNVSSIPAPYQAQRPAHGGGATFAYVTTQGRRSIWAYEVDPESGVQTPVRRSPFGTREYPWGVAAVPGKFLYVANGIGTDQNNPRHSHVTAYTIKGDGALARISGSPFQDRGRGAADMAVSVSKKYAYVVNIYSGDVSGYAIDPNSGALTSLPGSPFGAGGEPETLGLDPKGHFVYVANTLTDDVSAFKIDKSTGALGSVAGSPYRAGKTPAGVAVDCTGRFLYVTNANSNDISAYNINRRSGALTKVAGSPFHSNTPSRVVADPKAGFIYVTNNGSNTVSAYAINPSSGALTAVSGSPFTTGGGPSAIATDPTGSFLYVADNGSNNISAYLIDATSGALTPIAGSPFSTGTAPAEIVVTR